MVFVMELADMLACEARFWEFEAPQTPLIRPFLSEFGPGPNLDKLGLNCLVIRNM